MRIGLRVDVSELSEPIEDLVFERRVRPRDFFMGKGEEPFGFGYIRGGSSLPIRGSEPDASND